jgi:putative transposase
MKYDPAVHRRRSIRLRGYDYSQAGAYFITICVQDRRCLFGEIVDGGMRLNGMGRIIAEQWDAIPRRFTNVELDEFVVMPNHVHGIIVIVGAPLAGAQNPAFANHRTPVDNRAPVDRAPARGAPTVGDIVGAYKSLCVHQGLKWIKQNQPGSVLGKLWQRNYWEHIVRDESELNLIREYIGNNPSKWTMDKLFIPPDIRSPVLETRGSRLHYSGVRRLFH